MKIHIGENIRITEPTAVTIGKFDGLHRGHVALIKALAEQARNRGLSAALLTFDPHPAAFFASEKNMPLLLSTAEKREMLASMGIEHYIEYPFTSELAGMPPEDFIREVLQKRLNARLLAVGQDYRFGRNRAGDAETLRACGLEVHIIKPISIDCQKISSNAIREALAVGDISLANKMLGYPYKG